MKKILLMCSMVLLSSVVRAQSLYASKSSVESDEEFTVLGLGETSSAYFVSFSTQSTGISTSPANGSTWINVRPMHSIQFYNQVTSTPGSFKLKIANTHPTTDYTVTITVLTNIGGTVAQSNVYKAFTLEVKHAPVITYSSAAKTGTFIRNNCAPGYTSTPVSYTLAAGAQTSTVSQADADAKATTLFNTNGQANANAQGSCIPDCSSAPSRPGFITVTTGPTIGHDRVMLEIQAVSGAISYKWYKDGVLISGTGRTITTRLINDGEEHVFEVEAVNACGASLKRSVTATGW